MKKVFLILISLVFLFSCDKHECLNTTQGTTNPCDSMYIEMYNLRGQGTPRGLFPYDCSLTKEENFQQCDCYSMSGFGCRVITL